MCVRAWAQVTTTFGPMYTKQFAVALMNKVRHMRLCACAPCWGRGCGVRSSG